MKTESFRRAQPAVLSLMLVLGFTLAGPRAEAGQCALDQVPAATLLLPYFEVDYTTPNSPLTTLVRLQNATAEPTLVHMTLWTQWGQPTVDIDFFFTGYDVVTFNLFDLFNGNVAITADRQSDFSDTISPHGAFPEWDGSFPGCGNFFPFFVNPVIRGNNLERVRRGHTGQPLASLGSNRCLGPDYGDNIGRGYVSFDVVSTCSTAFAFDVGYFLNGGAGIGINRNAIFGDWHILDPARAITYGGPLVAVEADADFDATSTPTGYTFFGKEVSGGNGGDNREPLGAVWDFSFAAGASAADPFLGTEVIVWRDTTSAFWPNNGFDCTTGPDFAPMDEASVVCFDEQENAIELCGGEGETCFPFATQRVAFDQGLLAQPFLRGFCRLDLDNPGDSPTNDRDFPASGPTVQQSYVSTLRFGAPGIGAALAGTPVRHACSAPPAAAAAGEP